MDIETTVMELIIAAGEAKSLAMQALHSAKRGEWAQVDTLLAESAAASRSAHEVQTTLIGMDEGEGKLPVTLILVHAQDHIMTSMLAREMIAEMIELHRTIQQLKEPA
ncbi:PTS lactose/cellobiose transporter subunit IIA [Paludibacterium yongneupense]|uniref:PTS lactose/cellobiose transporter subunit IIA n=1 Tax=Paludibacterium yongneupense TaxID=400061 RepID=UPI0004238EE4|nr:PTS lactose/cellobiose transporter subunit IIA [Paludibacterium yongneupense]